MKLFEFYYFLFAKKKEEKRRAAYADKIALRSTSDAGSASPSNPCCGKNFAFILIKQRGAQKGRNLSGNAPRKKSTLEDFS